MSAARLAQGPAAESCRDADSDAEAFSDESSEGDMGAGRPAWRRWAWRLGGASALFALMLAAQWRWSRAGGESGRSAAASPTGAPGPEGELNAEYWHDAAHWQKEFLGTQRSGEVLSDVSAGGAEGFNESEALGASPGGDLDEELGATGWIQHYAQDCYGACGGPGMCESFCGTGNACCMFMNTRDPDECQGVGFWPALTWHTCVKASNPPPAEPKEEEEPEPEPPAPAPASADGAAAEPIPLVRNHWKTKPPTMAMEYNGMAWEPMSFSGLQRMHILAIGDWGGMDGGVITEVRPGKDYRRIIQYKGGDTDGPHVMARSRTGCKFNNLVECFNTKGVTGFSANSCLPACGWTEGIDDQAQYLVAKQFKKRAAEVDPQFILNVGDNFYWGGIETDCGTSMGEISKVAKQQFDDVFERIYSGPGLDGKPWLSVLGNHDWGGRYFNAGWDQQIAYTWASDRWIMPAPYWSQRVEYPSQSFSADIFMTDSNVFDALEPDKDPEHNICGALHTPAGASCTAAGGPPSLEGCRAWFKDFWHTQQQWLEGKLEESDATWQIVVTHFPCGHASSWYRKLHWSYGLDLLVTGHRHEQELWSRSSLLGGMTCIVTGGGGGITSEVSPEGHYSSSTQYGFFDLSISATSIHIELINQEGSVEKKAVVYPKLKSVR